MFIVPSSWSGYFLVFVPVCYKAEKAQMFWLRWFCTPWFADIAHTAGFKVQANILWLLDCLLCFVQWNCSKSDCMLCQKNMCFSLGCYRDGNIWFKLSYDRMFWLQMLYNFDPPFFKELWLRWQLFSCTLGLTPLSSFKNTLQNYNKEHGGKQAPHMMDQISSISRSMMACTL
jgi:hypothetical protein